MSDSAIWEAIATQNGPPVYRVRVILRAAAECELPLLHGPIVYALLCDANSHASDQKPAMPDGILPDVVERAVTHLSEGELYAFGLTVLGDDPHRAAARVASLVRGLRHIGRHPKARSLAFRRFSVDRVEDLVADAGFNERSLSPVPHDWIVDQVDRVLSSEQIRLRFDAPLRTQRPKREKRDGHGFFDALYFNPELLVSRILGRLQALGFSPLPKVENVSMRVAENRLVWLDARYGLGKGKTLGGSVGDVTVAKVDPVDAWAVALGQLVHVGENTRFGFGRYWIVDDRDADAKEHAKQDGLQRTDRCDKSELPEATVDRLICDRALSLVDRSLAATNMDQTAMECGLESGVLSAAVREAISGHYRCGPHIKVQIPKSGGHRELSIPTIRDRGLQRLVLDRLAPALDQCWEQAAMAYRRGLGRQDAARRVREAYRKGYRWAVKSDFMQFFDRIDHRLLRDRLSAYLADRAMVSLVMQWIRSGSPAPDRGLPTGAPVSPLLANLFLDQFDEEIEAAGGFLIRYADDFMVLTKTREQAEQMLEEAREEAERLGLELNREKSKFVHLRGGFNFLGLRFDASDHWYFSDDRQPVLLEDLGWHKAKPKSHEERGDVVLGGQSDWAGHAAQSIVVWGPGTKELAYEGQRLVCSLEGDRPTARLVPDKVHSIIVLGIPLIRPEAMRMIASSDIRMWICDDAARIHMEVMPERPLEDAAAVMAQCAVAGDPVRRLAIGKQLVAAKISNYAHLATRLNPPDYRLGRRIAAHAKDVLHAGTLEEMLGYEGAAAAIWYGQWQRWLPKGFFFPGRVAPGASDPVNACLNLSQTILHRYICMTIRMTGMVPSVGLLHQTRSGHATLASDLQEPLRHLMDLVVLQTLARLRPQQFRMTENEDYPLHIQPHARGVIEAAAHELLATPCAGQGQSEPAPYRLQALRMARSLRVHLRDESKPFRVFRHP